MFRSNMPLRKIRFERNLVDYKDTMLRLLLIYVYLDVGFLLSLVR